MSEHKGKFGKDVSEGKFVDGLAVSLLEEVEILGQSGL